MRLEYGDGIRDAITRCRVAWPLDGCCGGKIRCLTQAAAEVGRQEFREDLLFLSIGWLKPTAGCLRRMGSRLANRHGVIRDKASGMWIHRAARHTATILITVLLGGLLGATLLRFAPGFGVDEQELDTRLSGATIQALRDSHAAERNVLVFYARYLSGLLRGDLGVSRSLQRPISELLSQRIPVTLRLVAFGLLAGWLLGLALALPGAISGKPAHDILPGFLSGALLSLPSALVAVLFVLIGGPGPLAIALVIAPKVYRYSRNLLAQTSALPHVLAARAKGLSRLRILLWHVLPIAAPQIIALAGVSVSIAFGASIPIEVICDFPGIGQLAWQAALARDMPLLVNLTVLVTVVTLVANSASDLAVSPSSGRQ